MKCYIPENLFNNRNIPSQAKLIYLYLSSMAIEAFDSDNSDDDESVRLQITSTEISSNLGIDLRQVQFYLKYLYDNGCIGRWTAERKNIPYPMLYLHRDTTSDNIMFMVREDLCNVDSSLYEDEKVSQILNRWNDTHKTNIKFESEIKNYVRRLLDEFSIEDILLAIDNHAVAINKDSDYWNHSSKLFFKDSLKLFLKSPEGINVWKNKRKTEEARNILKRFEYN